MYHATRAGRTRAPPPRFLSLVVFFFFFSSWRFIQTKKKKKIKNISHSSRERGWRQKVSRVRVGAEEKSDHDTLLAAFFFRLGSEILHGRLNVPELELGLFGCDGDDVGRELAELQAKHVVEAALLLHQHLGLGPAHVPELDAFVEASSGQQAIYLAPRDRRTGLAVRLHGPNGARVELARVVGDHVATLTGYVEVAAILAPSEVLAITGELCGGDGLLLAEVEEREAGVHGAHAKECGIGGAPANVGHLFGGLGREAALEGGEVPEADGGVGASTREHVALQRVVVQREHGFFVPQQRAQGVRGVQLV
eukprot:TRINITY_DN4832_c0_g1_i1.p2 TRINITY_DN4832_c0_g1~~TRINITY_DN4832_c0_g1_i1.p2  ORF type:complete len:309 (-),score=-29.98 TRINITY_DN4832_c0_g1_i1:872-1798(-)